QALRQRLHHFMWVVLAVPLLMAQSWDDMNAMLWGMTVVECAALVVLLAVQQHRGALHQMLSAPALMLVGKLSYGIYLWHYPVVRYLRADLPWPAVVVLGFLISAALAALSYYTVERWAMRWRDARPAQRKPTPVRTARPATARGSLALSARGGR
ncbi:MAG: acyltransferase, partial [Acidovorax sp.]|nr:acyltransferase [Acidovorax sp.]